MNRSTIDRPLSEQAFSAYTDLAKSVEGLRALSALLECYGDHGTSGDGYTPPAHLAIGIASLLDMAATSISQQSDEVERVERGLSALEQRLDAATADARTVDEALDRVMRGVRHA